MGLKVSYLKMKKKKQRIKKTILQEVYFQKNKYWNEFQIFELRTFFNPKKVTLPTTNNNKKSSK